MIRATRELDYFSAYICLREPDKSVDKVEIRKLAGNTKGDRQEEDRRTYRKNAGGYRIMRDLEGSAEINKNQHSSVNPTQESAIGELKQHGGLEFDYSTTTTESNWEPRGVLQPKQKIEDLVKGEEMQRLQ
ncbi:hypothetical protein BHE74_00005541 [Ensete ventricosum]|nr:hypothetical protein BHE74_00005541 [Ensete ventricosum]